MKKKLGKGIITLMASTMILSGATPVIAEDLETEVTESMYVSVATSEDLYSELVKEGIISKERANEMKEYVENYSISFNENREKNEGVEINTTIDIYKEMVKDGIISAIDKENIDAFYEKQMQESRKTMIEETVNRYLEEEIINKETAEQIVNFTQESLNVLEKLEVSEVVLAEEIDVNERKDSLDILGKEELSDDVDIFFDSYIPVDLLVSDGVISENQKELMKASDEKYYKESIKTVETVPSQEAVK